MKSISSKQNAWFKRLRAAVREHAGEIVIEGPKAVSDAIRGGWKPIVVVVRERRDGEPIGLIERDPLVFVRELFDSVAETKTSQGVAALFERPHSDAAAILASRRSVIVALDGVQDPGNVGTIVRLSAAFDAAGVLLLPGCADPFAPKAVRASAGAILNVPVAPAAAHELIGSGLPVYAADAMGSAEDPPVHGAILLFGNEGAGVSPELRIASRQLAIPMSARVESLNVATAAAILLARSYALRRH